VYTPEKKKVKSEQQPEAEFDQTLIGVGLKDYKKHGEILANYF
jgi:hypothetical protein